MNTTIATLLQLTASLLMGAHSHSQTVQKQIIQVSQKSIQLSAEAIGMSHVTFAIPQNNSIWPSAVEVDYAPYLDTNGTYVHEGTNVKTLDQYLSFGDMNNDGLDDAAVLVQKIDANGKSTYALATVLNEGTIFFNIADFDLGATEPQIASHAIVNGKLVLSIQKGDTSYTTSTYELFGDQIFKD
jgi:hypothetical protein